MTAAVKFGSDSWCADRIGDVVSQRRKKTTKIDPQRDMKQISKALVMLL